MQQGLKLEITKKQLLKIVHETIDWSNHIDGQPFPGSLEDLAMTHGKPWGNGMVVDPTGWSSNVKLATQFTHGTAPSILKNKTKKTYTENKDSIKMKITKRQLRKIIKEENAKLMEQPSGWDNFSPEAEAADEARLGLELELEEDMSELLTLLEKAQGKAAQISVRMHRDQDYHDTAGGREADDLRAALQRIWEVFGMDTEEL